MDISDLAPQIAALIGVQPSTLLLLIMIITTGANVTARLIPDDAKGPLGVVRKLASIVGAHVSSRLTSGVTVNDAARAALAEPIKRKEERVRAVADMREALVRMAGMKVIDGLTADPAAPLARE